MQRLMIEADDLRYTGHLLHRASNRSAIDHCHNPTLTFGHYPQLEQLEQIENSINLRYSASQGHLTYGKHSILYSDVKRPIIKQKIKIQLSYVFSEF
jgi:hypothetical protein